MQVSVKIAGEAWLWRIKASSFRARPLALPREFTQAGEREIYIDGVHVQELAELIVLIVCLHNVGDYAGRKWPATVHSAVTGAS